MARTSQSLTVSIRFRCQQRSSLALFPQENIIYFNELAALNKKCC